VAPDRDGRSLRPPGPAPEDSDYAPK
jgi:hypothetical protein